MLLCIHGSREERIELFGQVRMRARSSFRTREFFMEGAGVYWPLNEVKAAVWPNGDRLGSSSAKGGSNDKEKVLRKGYDAGDCSG